MTTARRLAAAGLSLLPAVAAAGGSWAPATVAVVERGGWLSATRVVLDWSGAERPVPEALAACDRLTVHVRRAPPWAVRSFPPEASRDSHREALARLETAANRGGVVRFGVVGQGLRAAPGDPPCTARSRGLWLARSLGEEGVLSLHDAP